MGIRGNIFSFPPWPPCWHLPVDIKASRGVVSISGLKGTSAFNRVFWKGSLEAHKSHFDTWSLLAFCGYFSASAWNESCILRSRVLVLLSSSWPFLLPAKPWALLKSLFVTEGLPKGWAESSALCFSWLHSPCLPRCWNRELIIMVFLYRVVSVQHESIQNPWVQNFARISTDVLSVWQN